MPDPKFPSDDAADNSASDCDQLAVIITEREKAWARQRGKRSI